MVTERSKQQRLLRIERRKEHLCTVCGKPLPVYKRGERRFTTCISCRRRRRGWEKSKNRRRYLRAKKAGLCVVCKRNFAIPGLTMCDFCSDRKEMYRTKVETEMRELGFCICGKTRDREDLKYCAACRKAGAKRSLNSRNRRKSAAQPKKCSNP